MWRHCPAPYVALRESSSNGRPEEGLGGIAQSWVGTGANQPVSADQLLHVLGSDNVAQFAGKLNVSPEELLNKLSELLPEHIDKMTPGGVIPKG